MKCYIVNGDNNSVYYNLAIEQTMAESLEKDSAVLFLWQNSKTVVIGRHQNPYRECNLSRMQEDDITLARRPSGGGAVYHDINNLNFTFIYRKEDYNLACNFQIIIDALKSLGINAELSGRNDILCEEKKFSGNAFYSTKTATVHHGTIMIGVDMAGIMNYLNVSKLKLQSKGVKSVASRVVNLKAIREDIDVIMVREAISKTFLKQHNKTEAYAFDVNASRANEIECELKAPDYLLGKKHNFCNEVSFRFSLGEVVVCKDENNEIQISSDLLKTELIDYAKNSFKKNGQIEISDIFSDEEKDLLTGINNMVKEVSDAI